MKMKLKTSSLSLKSETSLHNFQGVLQSLFFELDQWSEEHLSGVVGIMHSLTFPKEGTLSCASGVNQILAREYHSRGWPVLGGDTSGGKDLVLSVTLVGF